MELHYPISLLIFFTALFVIVMNRFRTLDTHKNLPPQPRKLPLLGHIHHLIGAQPHRALKNIAQKLGPIVHLQLGQVSAVVISSPSFAKEIMKTHDISFANRPQLLGGEIVLYNYTDIVFSPYGDYWRQLRKICTLELLSAKKVKSFRSLREQESWKLVESMSKLRSTTVNLTEKIFTTTNTVVCKVTVGSKSKDQAKLIEVLKELIYLTSGFDGADLFPSMKLVLSLISPTRKKLMKIRNKLDEIFDDIISVHEEHRVGNQISRDSEDLLDVLLRLKNDGDLECPITSDNIKAVLVDMFGAGTDTSSVTIEWAMSELIRNPRVMKKAQTELRQVLNGKMKIHESDIQELVYLKLVIKETFRLHPPIPLCLPRECREKCEIGGYQIPIKTQVIINAWKMGRDPDYWVDPESFIPERFSESTITMMGTDFEYLPFGSGRRMCPGITMGLANVELPLAMLLYHFNWELPNGATYEDFDMRECFGVTLKRKTNLLLVPSPYITNY